jgi:hypothetical protein
MSQPLLERLSRFTPDAGGLDRDKLLYAAGRASARPNRGWIALAAALAVTQVLTVVLLWPRPAPPVAHTPPPAAQPAAPPAPPEPPTTDSPDSPGIWSVHHNLQEPEAEDRPSPDKTVTVIDSGPPLRAFGPPPPSLLN